MVIKLQAFKGYTFLIITVNHVRVTEENMGGRYSYKRAIRLRPTFGLQGDYPPSHYRQAFYVRPTFEKTQITNLPSM